MPTIDGNSSDWLTVAAVFWRTLGLCLIALLMPSAMRAQPVGSPSREYQLKAVFLFNFALFVEWPSTAFPESKTPLVIGLLGDDPFGDYLDSLVKGEKVRDHALVVRRFHRVEEVDTCHVLFIAASEAPKVESILAAMRSRSILTVGDMPDFSAHGGMIRFLTENAKIRLRINPDLAKAAGLSLSSKLLRPADIVSAQSP